MIQVSLGPLPADDSIREQLTGLLLTEGFDSFWEDGDVIRAFIEAGTYSPEDVHDRLHEAFPHIVIGIQAEPMSDINWNAEWEKNFDPVLIEDQIYIYAPFHDATNDIPFQICIMPKMSFGTAHHPTTASMLKLMSEMDFSGKTVIDAGTGTGILGIFAEMRGAISVFAYDNDRWSVENALENIERNNCNRIIIKLGEQECIHDQSCDVLVANIHRNVLLADIPAYAKSLGKGGMLLMSGFYTEDLPDITETCEKHGFGIDHFIVKENWVAARYTKEM